MAVKKTRKKAVGKLTKRVKSSAGKILTKTRNTVPKRSMKKESAKKISHKKRSVTGSVRTKDISKVSVAISKSVSMKKTPQKLSAKQRKSLKERLIELRDRLNGQITSLKQDSLTRNDSVVSVEDGTDAFERQFALNIVSSENEALVEIDEALRRLEDGTYGVCEECECIIDVPRLAALPFVRMCVKCQSEAEKARRRYHHFDVERSW